MVGRDGRVIVHNGEVYNYLEIRDELKGRWEFRGTSDTEVMLAACSVWGDAAIDRFSGMYATAIWEPSERRFFAFRDRFGIKPFYYAVANGCFYFASEAKSLLPFLSSIKTNAAALDEYLTFQYTLGDDTLFEGIKELKPGHSIEVSGGLVRIKKYWDIQYEVDFMRSSRYFTEQTQELLERSVRQHLRSDVEVGGYISGGIDSSLIASLAKANSPSCTEFFCGKFSEHKGFDESYYARRLAEEKGLTLHEVDITADDFAETIHDVIFHLDFPVGGPGAFPQFMVSKHASKKLKVVLGGQGGDELFGGYARYLVAYLEQCIKAAIDGTYANGDFVVTIESIFPNLTVLQEYKPMIANLWKEGLFGGLDSRYFRLLDKSSSIDGLISINASRKRDVYETFQREFNDSGNVRKQAYLDKMMHFDFKFLLPALLQVEDRMSMAHGLESRVPFLDHSLVEMVATMPADIKFEGGVLKRMLKSTFSDVLPSEIVKRRDKMGFPVPTNIWFQGELRDFVFDTLTSQCARGRGLYNADGLRQCLEAEQSFSRGTWALLSLELWQSTFHDREQKIRDGLAVNETPITSIADGGGVIDRYAN